MVAPVEVSVTVICDPSATGYAAESREASMTPAGNSTIADGKLAGPDTRSLVALSAIGRRRRIAFGSITHCVPRLDTSIASTSRIFAPPVLIPAVSAAIAAEIAQVAYRCGLAAGELPQDMLAHVKSHMYEPRYCSYA